MERAFSAKGAPHTSLGHRPREPGKAPRSGQGLKARPMLAPRGFCDQGVGKRHVACMARAFSPRLGLFVVGHAFLGRWPRLEWDAPLALWKHPSLFHGLGNRHFRWPVCGIGSERCPFLSSTTRRSSLFQWQNSRWDAPWKCARIGNGTLKGDEKS